MAKIKAVIFDLDDTLFDCTGQLVQEARKRAAKALSKEIRGVSVEEIFKREIALYKRFGPTFKVFDKICEEFNVKNKEECITAALKAYNSDTVGNIKMFEDVLPLFKELRKKGMKLVLITGGIHRRQEKKIRLLDLHEWMDLILIHDIEKATITKEDLFREALTKLSLKPNNVLNVGDRIQEEIQVGNRLGLPSVRVLHGHYRNMKPENDLEEPNFEIERLSELVQVIDSIEAGKTHKPKIVAIGGGTGLPMVLNGLKNYSKNLTAIVTVSDTGRSSGVLRRDLRILPPGDLRNCLIALSDSEQLLLDLFKYRFDKGSLKGHSFGNLFIAALTKITGSFNEAVRETSRILAIKGKVLPATLQDTHVCAELQDGTIVEEESNVRKLGKSRIKRVFLMHEAKPLQESLEAIKEADLIVMGPGSLFTSIVPNLLVDGIPEAIKKSKARKVYVANIMTQPGQTDAYSLSMHIAAIEKYLGRGVLNLVLFNKSKPAASLLKKYARENAFLVRNDIEKIPRRIGLIEKDLLERSRKQILWQKQYLLRHDSEKLGKALAGLVSQLRCSKR